MPKDEWGVKRLCAACGARFYDLHRDPVDCPKCEATYTPAPAPGSKGKVSKAAAAPVAAAKVEDDEDEDVAVVEEVVIDDDEVVVDADADDDDDDDSVDNSVLLADDDDDDDDLGDFAPVNDDDKDT